MIYVFGAINLDIVAKKDRFTKNTSNISSIDLSLGGVGHNIYKNLKSKNKKFITVIGQDFFTSYLKSYLRTLNSSFHINKKCKNGKYLAFMEDGKLIYGAGDTKVSEEGFTRTFLLKTVKQIKEKDLVIIDANLNPDAIEFIINVCKKKKTQVIFETVSVEKTLRSRNVLKDIFLMGPTEEELKALLGRFSKQSIISFMNKNRIQNLILTKGKEGLEWYFLKDLEGQKNVFKPHNVIKAKDTTGAGDLLLASIVNNMTKFNIHKSIELSMRQVEAFLRRKI